jgi:hypothetical protein
MPKDIAWPQLIPSVERISVGPSLGGFFANLLIWKQNQALMFLEGANRATDRLCEIIVGIEMGA